MRVGTSGVNIVGAGDVEDHPHACGDKSAIDENETPALGSSPCVWGQVRTLHSRKVSLRIIPMRVGTSFFSTSQQREVQDHPHACGDKAYQKSKT